MQRCAALLTAVKFQEFFFRETKPALAATRRKLTLVNAPPKRRVVVSDSAG
jgi:hypothetical protein